MMYGTVKWFGARNEEGEEKPYGFVQGMDGQDYHVHIDNVNEARWLNEEDKVVFTPGQGRRGLKCRELWGLDDFHDTDTLRQLLVRSLDTEFDTQPLIRQFSISAYRKNESMLDAFDALWQLVLDGYYPSEQTVEATEIINKLSQWIDSKQPAQHIAMEVAPHYDFELQKELWKKFNTPPPKDLSLKPDDLKELSTPTILTLLEDQEIFLRLIWDLTENEQDEDLIGLYHFFDACRKGSFYIPQKTMPSIFAPNPTSTDKRPKPNDQAIALTMKLVTKAMEQHHLRGAFRYIPYILDLADDMLPQIDPKKIPPKLLPDGYQRQLFKKIVFQVKITKEIQNPSEFWDAELWSDFTIHFILALDVTRLDGHRFQVDRYIVESAMRSCKPWHKEIRLYDLFENCPGRMERLYNHLSGKFEYRRVEKSVYLEFCEGRIYKRKEADFLDDQEMRTVQDEGQTLVLEKKTCWWCRNKRCYLDARHLDKSLPANVTFKDYLDLLEYPVDWETYKNILGYFNQYNRLQEKMKCRCCGEYMGLLDRAGNEIPYSNFAYRRVSRFSCANPDCAEPDENVYLTHCLNKDCLNIVDSRVSAKCEPQGLERQKFGWYICDYCLACCSSEKLEQRNRRLIEVGQLPNCHLEGHWDRGEICCPKCGHLLNFHIPKGLNAPFAKMVVDWFDSLGVDANNGPILSKGKRESDGSFWYRFKYSSLSHLLRGIDQTVESYMRHLMKYGFHVPDIENETFTPNQFGILISTPTGNIKEGYLTFNQCDYRLDFQTIPKEEREDLFNALSFHKPLISLNPRNSGRRRNQNPATEGPTSTL